MRKLDTNLNENPKKTTDYFTKTQKNKLVFAKSAKNQKYPYPNTILKQVKGVMEKSDILVSFKLQFIKYNYGYNSI